MSPRDRAPVIAGGDSSSVSAGAPEWQGQPPPLETAEEGADRLGRTQVQSIVVNFTATALLALQNLAVLSLLDRRELGLLGIASGVAALALMAQYFGVGAATLKEVAVAESRERASQLMLSALVLRLLLSAPIVVLLVGGAGWIASSVYDHPELRTPLYLSAATVVLYGVSDVFAYTLQGLHLWRRFFVVKFLTSVLQLPVVVLATIVGGVQGYFAGLVGAAAIGALVSLAGVISPVRIPALPRVVDLASDMRAMIGLGLSAYAAKILQVLIIQAPVLIAGYYYAAEVVGDLKFALTLGGVLLGLSGAINTINIAVFSRRFARDERLFRRGAAKQLVIYSAATGLTVAVTGLLAPELVALVGVGRYDGAVAASVLALIGSALYGFIGVIVSTVHVPAGSYGFFVALYLIGTVVTVAIALAVSKGGGEVWALAAAFVAGSGIGVAAGLADIARRGLFSRTTALGLIGIVGLAGVPALGLPDVVRYALVLALVSLLVASRRRVIALVRTG